MIQPARQVQAADSEALGSLGKPDHAVELLGERVAAGELVGGAHGCGVVDPTPHLADATLEPTAPDRTPCRYCERHAELLSNIDGESSLSGPRVHHGEFCGVEPHLDEMAFGRVEDGQSLVGRVHVEMDVRERPVDKHRRR